MPSRQLDGHDHPHGLEHDLAGLTRRLHGRRLQERRQALLWLVSGGVVAALAACGGGGAEGASSGTAEGTQTGATPYNTLANHTAVASGASGSSCVADPEQTNGPYPADGSNSVKGIDSDILTTSGVVRSNLRSSFGSARATAAGVPVVLTLNLINVATNCSVLEGYAIYLWQCNAAGEYSLYADGIQNENYLRGVQVADANGQVTFETIFPACYSGRYPHIHFEVYRSLAVATVYSNAVLTAQMAMPSAICNAVYGGSSLYSASVANFADLTTATDTVFADSTAGQLAAQTPSFTGSVTEGFTGTLTIGVAV